MYVHFRHHVRLDAILEGALKYLFYLANFTDTSSQVVAILRQAAFSSLKVKYIFFLGPLSQDLAAAQIT